MKLMYFHSKNISIDYYTYLPYKPYIEIFKSEIYKVSVIYISAYPPLFNSHISKRRARNYIMWFTLY